jgi:hypothetical protein
MQAVFKNIYNKKDPVMKIFILQQVNVKRVLINDNNTFFSLPTEFSSKYKENKRIRNNAVLSSLFLNPSIIVINHLFFPFIFVSKIFYPIVVFFV